MKILLKILIITILLNRLTFAKSGFEYGFQVPIGMSVGINRFILNKDSSSAQQSNYNSKLKQNSKNSYVGFDLGISAHLGYNFEFRRNMSLSLLFETGYSHDTFSSYSKNNGSSSVKNLNYYIFESMIFGIYPKFNWNKFSFGIAGGIKVPLYARIKDSVVDYQNSKITQNIEIIKANQMKNIFKVPVIPYLKFSVDYLIYSDKKLNLYLGGYIGYDFGMYLTTPIFNDNDLRKILKQNISSFDLGFQIGVKII